VEDGGRPGLPPDGEEALRDLFERLLHVTVSKPDGVRRSGAVIRPGRSAWRGTARFLVQMKPWVTA